MKLTFARIIPQNTIYHDLLLTLIEPSVLSTELACCLRGRGGQIEVRDDTDEAGQGTLQGKEPSLEFVLVCPTCNYRVLNSPILPFH